MTNPRLQTRRSRSRRAPVILLLLTTLLALSWYLYSQITWIDYQTKKSITEQARNNPYLAATIFLQDHGVRVRSAEALQDFDHPLHYQDEHSSDTIMLVDAYGSLSTQRMQNLLAWAEQGGHLIASASNRFADNIAAVSDPLFEHFGVLIDRQHDTEPEQEVWAIINRYGYLAGITGSELCSSLGAQTQFSFQGDTADIGVHFLSTDFLQAEGRSPDAWIGEPAFAYLLQYDVGDGMVTLVTSLDLWKNSAIGCLDHAWFLWQLAPQGGSLTIYSNFEFPGVIAILWRHFATTMITAAILLMLWLWYRGVRFGPIRETRALQRRQLLEHIDASANFLWRVGKADYLATGIRAQIWQQIRLLHPQLMAAASGLRGNKAEPDSAGGGAQAAGAAPSEALLANKLALLLGLSTQQIHLALWQPIDNNHQRMTDILAAMQQIKEKL